jgi:D-alanine-D-alanine ligase
MPPPATLILVHEPEHACRDRLIAEGLPSGRAREIGSYLAQSTDIAADFGEIEQACAQRGLRFRPVVLDEAPAAFAKADPASTVVWTLTDGIAYFRGGAAPALARLWGLRTLGSDDSVFALCQDKFRSGAVLRAFGIPVPPAGLLRGRQVLVELPASSTGWFVKPNRLGAKIGIWENSHCRSTEAAIELGARIREAYGDDAIVQPHVPGRNVRSSFLAVDPDADMAGALRSVFVDSGGDFQTMAESLALYGGTGADARSAGSYAEPKLEDVAGTRPRAAAAIRAIAERLTGGLGLRDVFSLDFRVGDDDAPQLLEFEVCPGLPCFDFRDYCRRRWKMSLAEAMAEAARRRLRR